MEYVGTGSGKLSCSNDNHHQQQQPPATSNQNRMMASHFLHDCGASLVWQHPDKKNGSKIYLGPKQAAQDRLALRKGKITGIVNCTTDIPCWHDNHKNNKNNNNHPIKYCQVPVQDEETAEILLYLPGACTFMETLLFQQGESVLVHCQFGVSRSATVVLAFVLLHHRPRLTTLQQAYEMIQAQRPKIQPNTGFWKQLQVWETMSQDDDGWRRPLISTGSDILSTKSPLLASSAWFATCRDLGPAHEQKWWQCMAAALAQSTKEINGFWMECLDLVWDRGVLTIDLEWFRNACEQLETDHQKSNPDGGCLLDCTLEVIMDRHSEFCVRHGVTTRQRNQACRIFLGNG